MRNQVDSYGTNRDNKRNITYTLTCILLTCLTNIIACAPELPANNDEEQSTPGTVEDWTDNGTITIPIDSGRPMTYADSIRFGLLPAE